MRLIFRPQADQDLHYWKKAGRRDVLRRISRLLRAIEAEPYGGLGKPEALKHDYAGWWSRRIDQEHRLVYTVEGDCIIIAQCRYHYQR